MRNGDLICALLLLGVAGVVMFEGQRLGVGWSTDGHRSGFFVFYLGLAMAVASAVVLAQAILRRDARLYAKRFVEPGQIVPVAKVLLPAILMVLFTHFIGLYVAGAVYLATYMRWIGRHPWLQTVLVSLAIPVVSFLIFEVWFLVPMPKGPLETYLGY